MSGTYADSLDVLLLAGDFYPKKSGGAFIDWNTAKHLVEAGDSVTVVTPRNAETDQLETVDGVEIRRPIRGHPADVHPNSTQGILWRLLFVVLVMPHLLNLCWRREFDLVYSTNHLLHPPATILTIVFQLPHISFVGYSPSIQEDISLIQPLVLLERINFRFFMGDRVLCQTPSIRDILSKVCDGELARLDGSVDKNAIEATINSSDTAEIESDSDSDIRLIFVGRLVDIKNPTKLPNLLSQLPEKYSLLIVGDGPQMQTVNSAINTAGVYERIELVGRVPHDKTLLKIYESDLLILPSKADAYPAVVFEALSLNTPVLSTPVGVLPTIDHPNLTIAQLDEFADIIPQINLDTSDGIDMETLEQFAVDRFAEDARAQMLKVVSSLTG